MPPLQAINVARAIDLPYKAAMSIIVNSTTFLYISQVLLTQYICNSKKVSTSFPALRNIQVMEYSSIQADFRLLAVILIELCLISMISRFFECPNSY